MKLSVFRKILKTCNEICPNAEIYFNDPDDNYSGMPDNVVEFDDRYNIYYIIPIIKLKGPKFPHATMKVSTLYTAFCRYMKSEYDNEVCIISGDEIYTVHGIRINNNDIIIDINIVSSAYSGLIEKIYSHIKFDNCYQSVIGFLYNESDFSLLNSFTVRFRSAADGDISYIFKVKRIYIKPSDLLFHIEVDYGKYKTHDLYLSDRYRYSVTKIDDQSIIDITLEGEGKW